MADYDFLSKGSDGGTIIGQSTASLIGFFSTQPVNQPDALTTALTTIAYTTATALVSVMVVSATGTSGYGFLTTDEAQAFLLAVQNLQIRVAQMDARLVELGLIDGGTALTTASANSTDFLGAGGGDDGIVCAVSTTTKVGFYGITPAVQMSAITSVATYATVTITATHTAGQYDYTIATLVSNSAGFGFSDPEQAASLCGVVSNMQLRIAQMETRLSTLGLIAGGTAVTSATNTGYDYCDKGNTDGTVIGTTATSKIAFWGTPGAQVSALTTALTTISCTAPGTATYTIQSLLATISTFKFVTVTAATTFIAAVQNAQIRVNQLEAALEALGVFPAQ